MPYHTKKGMKEGGCGCGCQAKTISNHPDPTNVKPQKEMGNIKMKGKEKPKKLNKPKNQRLNPY